MNNSIIAKHIKLIRRSNKDAFKTIFDYFQNEIFNYLVFKLNNIELAEDLLQDVFIKLWENRTNIDDKLSLKSYLYKIAKNLALNHLRHQKIVNDYAKSLTFHTKVNPNNPQLIFEDKELRNHLLSAINKLPAKARIIFLLSKVDGLTYKEIAERLNISKKTVETQIVRSLKSIRKYMSNYFDKKT